MTSTNKTTVSIVVIAYNIPRELPKTLASLALSYQRHIEASTYEVIVVDNGSSPPVDSSLLRGLGVKARLIRIDRAHPSPSSAINRGIEAASGDVVGVLIDGARLVTPGLVHLARSAVAMYPRAVVATLGWYLGSDLQRFSMKAGYDRAAEDKLLRSIDWPNDGYRLFEVGTLDESSLNGWLAPISESNVLFLSRETWRLLDGIDERFDQPGGGLLSLDVFKRAAELPEGELVILLGEGTFHQLHGGISTNVPDIDDRWTIWEGGYRKIRGRPYALPNAPPPTYLGSLPPSALAHFVRAAICPLPHHSPPLGPPFEMELWSANPIAVPEDAATASIVALAHTAFREKKFAVTAALARLARRRSPDEPEPQRLLRYVAGFWQSEDFSQASVDVQLAVADAYAILGERDLAANCYRAALSMDDNLVRAHVGLANLRLPGEFYYSMLNKIYQRLTPDYIVEIGVYEGRSISCARPPTLVVGVDPTPRLLTAPQTNVQLFAETSDDFFDRGRLDSILKGAKVDIGFIDGLHTFEQSLKDVLNLARHCRNDSIIMLHDTLPLDERTQRRECDTQFHTGDVWKTVVCLKHFCPDLKIATVAAPWTGLTILTGLGAMAGLLDVYDDAVTRFVDTPFSEIENDLERRLNIVANGWDTVERWFLETGVIRA